MLYFEVSTQHVMYLAGRVCRSCVTGRPDKFIPNACFLSAVANEKDQDKMLRALRVMLMLREDGRAELWQKVTHDIVKEGRLNMKGVITRSNLCDLIFFLSSPSSAGQITTLS